MNVSTINLRVLAAASIFASKEETRFYLNGVCVEFEPRAATYIATDGHRLIVYRDEIADTEAPDNLLIGAFVIPALQCKPFKLNKEDDAIAKIFGDTDTRLTMAHNFVDVTFAPIDCIYPDWRKVPPRGAADGKLAHFNLKYLADFRKFADQLGLGNPFVAHNGDKPALIWFGPHENVAGVIMPMRNDERLLTRTMPAWAAPQPEQQAAA